MTEPAAVPAGGLEHQLRLQLGLRRRQPHRLLPLRLATRSAPPGPRRTSRSSAPGEYDWQGYDPRTAHDANVLPVRGAPATRSTPTSSCPGTTSRRRGCSAADDKYSFGSDLPHAADPQLHRSGHRGRQKDGADTARQRDGRGGHAGHPQRRSCGRSSSRRSARRATRSCRKRSPSSTSWYADGGHRRDLTNTTSRAPAPTSTTKRSRSWTRGGRNCSKPSSSPALGGDAFDALQGHARIRLARTRAAQPAAPDFADGWYGYVSKDLRDVLAANGARARRRAAPTRACTAAAGSLAACRQALQSSLMEALSVTPQQIYGHGACAENPQASCFDMNRFTSASGVSRAAVPVPEPADVPAGRRTDEDAAALMGARPRAAAVLALAALLALLLAAPTPPASAAVPLRRRRKPGRTRRAGSSLPGKCPSNLGGLGWKFAGDARRYRRRSSPTRAKRGRHSEQLAEDELCGVTGMSVVDAHATMPAGTGSCIAAGTPVHTAFGVSLGRPDVSIAELDSGDRMEQPRRHVAAAREGAAQRRRAARAASRPEQTFDSVHARQLRDARGRPPAATTTPTAACPAANRAAAGRSPTTCSNRASSTCSTTRATRAWRTSWRTTRSAPTRRRQANAATGRRGCSRPRT